MALCMLLTLGIVEFVCGLRRAVFREISRPSMSQATGDNHLLITSLDSDTVMVYMLGGQLVHRFGRKGSDPGRLNGLSGICVDDSGAVYVADCLNSCMQVF